MIHLLIIAVTLVILSTVWLTSLRNTPDRNMWLIGTTGLWVWSFLTYAWANVTPMGDAAASMAPPVTLAMLCAFGVEACATDSVGRVREYRDALRGFVPWSVEAERLSDGKVGVYVRNGSDRQLVDSANPITDSEEFSGLKVRAEDVASTYNDLKIGPKTEPKERHND